MCTTHLAIHVENSTEQLVFTDWHYIFVNNVLRLREWADQHVGSSRRAAEACHSQLVLLGLVLLSRQAGRSDIPILLLEPISKPRQGVLMLLQYTLQLLLPLSLAAYQVCLSLWQGRRKLFV